MLVKKFDKSVIYSFADIMLFIPNRISEIGLRENQLIIIARKKDKYEKRDASILSSKVS